MTFAFAQRHKVVDTVTFVKKSFEALECVNIFITFRKSFHLFSQTTPPKTLVSCSERSRGQTHTQRPSSRQVD